MGGREFIVGQAVEWLQDYGKSVETVRGEVIRKTTSGRYVVEVVAHSPRSGSKVHPLKPRRITTAHWKLRSLPVPAGEEPGR